ncbi:hypothetical protein [Sporosarcina sp. BP05]|uniref:hypothetical protein n=1 Tax=Sporosarcina sp. BP05 TaxID=2758726 RepID=UPI001648F579|nr:hypothetical protein [Sporosarcina sp. BP05]
MRKQFALLLCFSLSVGLAACSSNQGEDTSPPKVEDSTNHKGSIGDEQEVPNINDPTKTDDTTTSPVNPSDNKSEDSAINGEQTKMAIDALKGLVLRCKGRRVFRLSDGFYIGKTSRKHIQDSIGKPEISDSYDHYTGSMGQASYDLSYDSKGILKEARYFGTNVERQTN